MKARTLLAFVLTSAGSLLVAPGCSSFTADTSSSPDAAVVGGDAAPDAGPEARRDGGADGSAPTLCSAAAALCDDFESGAYSSKWSESTKEGGTVSFSPAGGARAGTALRLRVPNGAREDAAAQLVFRTASAPGSLNLRFAVRRLTSSAATQLFAVIHHAADPSLTVAVGIDDGELLAAENLRPAGGAYTPHPSGFTVPPGEWVDLAVSLRLDGDAASLAVTANGAELLSGVALGAVTLGASVTVDVGLYVGGPYPTEGDAEILIDDVVVTD